MDEKLLEILGCPVDQEELELINDKLICTKCGKEYTINDGIPEMLISDYSSELGKRGCE